MSYYEQPEPEKFYGRERGQWVDQGEGGMGYSRSPPPLERHDGVVSRGYDPSRSLSPTPYPYSTDIKNPYAQLPSFPPSHPGSLVPSGFQPAQPGALVPSPMQWGGSEEYGGTGMQEEPMGRFEMPEYGLGLAYPGAPPTPAPGEYRTHEYAGYDADDGQMRR